jgi:uncharacterized membrane protein YfcA
MAYPLYILLGLVAGTLSGILGIGGGAIIIPALIYLFGMTQHQAQGTTLAFMVLPIGLLAAARYYQAGHVRLFAAGLMAFGFFFGGWIGASIAQFCPDQILKKVFGGFFLLIACQMIFSK